MKFNSNHGNVIQAFKREDGLFDIYVNGARVFWCHEEDLAGRVEIIDDFAQTFIDCAVNGGFVKYL